MEKLEEKVKELEAAKKATQSCLDNAATLVDWHGLVYWAGEVERLRKEIKESLRAISHAELSVWLQCLTNKIKIMGKKVKCVDILESTDFYYYCKRHGLTCGKGVDEWDDLAFFEGDPDMIKYKGRLGFFYFDKGNSTCYYYLEVLWDEKDEVERILSSFCSNLREYYEPYASSEWDDCSPDEIQNWKAWDKMQNGIAYRGGSGYIHGIHDISKFIKTTKAA